MEKICCLILLYNDASTTIKHINSIKKYKCFDHILVVDNCSTDHSWEELSKVDGITLVKTSWNGGYGAGNNFGIKYAKEVLGCQYVLLCNPDVRYSEELVTNLFGVITQHEECAVVTALQYDAEHKQIANVAWRLPNSFRYAFTFTGPGTKLIAKTLYQSSYFAENDVVEVDCVPGALLLIDAEKFISLGGYDEEMFLYCEEDTLACKLRKAGYITLMLTNYHYVHEHGTSINRLLDTEVKRMKLIHKNKILFMKKHMNARLFELMIGEIGASIKIWHLRNMSRQEKER